MKYLSMKTQNSEFVGYQTLQRLIFESNHYSLSEIVSIYTYESFPYETKQMEKTCIYQGSLYDLRIMYYEWMLLLDKKKPEYTETEFIIECLRLENEIYMSQQNEKDCNK